MLLNMHCTLPPIKTIQERLPEHPEYNYRQLGRGLQDLAASSSYHGHQIPRAAYPALPKPEDAVTIARITSCSPFSTSLPLDRGQVSYSRPDARNQSARSSQPHHVSCVTPHHVNHPAITQAPVETERHSWTRSRASIPNGVAKTGRSKKLVKPPRPEAREAHNLKEKSRRDTGAASSDIARILSQQNPGRVLGCIACNNNLLSNNKENNVSSRGEEDRSSRQQGDKEHNLTYFMLLLHFMPQCIEATIEASRACARKNEREKAELMRRDVDKAMKYTRDVAAWMEVRDLERVRDAHLRLGFRYDGRDGAAVASTESKNARHEPAGLSTDAPTPPSSQGSPSLEQQRYSMQQPWSHGRRSSGPYRSPTASFNEKIGA